MNHTVIGGFSKLISKLEKPISTFIDLRYGSGSYLTKLGFILKNHPQPSFMWTKGGLVKSRQTMLGNSGYQHGYKKIWDCGQAKYTLE